MDSNDRTIEVDGDITLDERIVGERNAIATSALGFGPSVRLVLHRRFHLVVQLR